MINYHNHTEMCGHATGTIEDYLNQAEKLGITEMGFSDHAPIPLPQRIGITMAPEETETYLSVLEKHKSDYKGNVQVKLGFEVDFPLTDTFNRAYFSDRRIDFLIGSCHFLDGWPFDHSKYIHEFERRDINEIYERYYVEIERLVDSELFDIVGHFDLIKKFGHRPTKNFKKTINKIAKKMSKNKTVAEINTSGLLKPVGEIYPSPDIIKIFFEENVPLTLGSDSHSPDTVGYYFPETIELLKKIGYRKLIGFTGRQPHEVHI